MNPVPWFRMLDLAQMLWWGFVTFSSLAALAVIGLNLRLMKKEPPG